MVSKKYKTINVESDILVLIENAKEEYLKHHKEMKGIVITNSKILREVIEFYLRA